MNIKRFITTGFVVFIAFQLMDMIIHGLLLGPTYASLPNLWRQEMMSMMWIMYSAGFVMSFLFVFIFIKGYENKGILEGLRFGLIIGLFMQIPAALGQYVVYPIPFTLAIQWFIYGTIEFIVAGIIAAVIYRPKV